MKILFELNGIGKSAFTNDKNEEEHLALTSSIAEWRPKNNDITDNKIKSINISQFQRELWRLEKKLDKEISEMLKAKTLPHKGSNASLKKYLDSTKLISEIRTQEFWKQKYKENEEVLFEQFHKIFQKFKKFKEQIDALSENEYNEILDIINVISNIKKLATIQGDSKLIIDHNTLIQDIEEAKKKFSKLFDEIWSLKGNEIRLIREGTEKIAREEMRKNVINLLLGYEHKAAIYDTICQINKLANNRLDFSEKDFKEIEKVVEGTKITSEKTSLLIENEKGLSRGQITILSVLSIIKSSNPSEDHQIFLDDVLETLDDENKSLLIHKLLNKDFINVLTHNSSDVDFINDIADDKEISINISGIDGEAAKIVTWGQLLCHIRSVDGLSDEEKRMRSIIKLMTRYIAKDGTIHCSLGELNKKEIESKDNFKHWLSSQWFFHYFPNIPFKKINAFFPWMNVSKNCSTIELINLLIKNVENMDQKNVKWISTKKVVQFLKILKKEHKIEKQALGFEPKILDAKNVSSEYKKIRNEKLLPERDNATIHKYEKSPYFITI